MDPQLAPWETDDCQLQDQHKQHLHHLGSHHYDALDPPLELQNTTLQSYLDRVPKRLTTGLDGYKENTVQYNSQLCSPGPTKA